MMSQNVAYSVIDNLMKPTYYDNQIKAKIGPDHVSLHHKRAGSLKGKVAVKVDDRTTIFVTPDKVEEIKEKYGITIDK